MRTVRTRLFVMMLLEYAVWGAWAAVAGKYLTDPRPVGLGFTGSYSGFLFSLLPLGAILSPLLFGQLADRYLRAERLQGVLSLLCAGVLFALGRTTDATPFLWWMVAYSFLFAPTVTLTNAIAFAHLSDPTREFGSVRVGGTFGWFLALGCLAGWRAMVGGPVPGDLFFAAAAFSAVLGLYSFLLPATPPAHRGGKALAFLEALALLKDRNFAVFFGLCFVIGAQLDFYYIFVSAFLGTPQSLGGAGATARDVPLLLMIAPISELFVMGFLGKLMPKLGIKRALALGFAAWIVRFAVFATAGSVGASVLGLAVHGVCFTFVFAVASLYVNRIAPPAIRASGQALVTLSLVGLGRYAGTFLAGWVHSGFTRPLARPVSSGGLIYSTTTDWTRFFAVPLGMTVVATLLLMAFFREPQSPKFAAAG
ncbi:MAG: MFS transporter [Fimbriimonadaceae bacterium]|nr:MFS transporter [Fimbriimonadaceae bacterium]